MSSDPPIEIPGSSEFDMYVSGLEAEVERLRAIVARLPHTADLVTVTSSADSSYPSNAYLVYPLCCSAREAAEAEGGEK